MGELDTPRARHWGHSEDKVKALDTVALSLGGKVTVQQQMAANVTPSTLTSPRELWPRTQGRDVLQSVMGDLS